MSDEQHLEWLNQKFTEYDNERRKAEAVLARVQPLVEHTLALIQAIEAEQGREVSTNQAALQPELSVHEGTKAPMTISAKRPSQMPPRRLEYRGMTTVAAAVRVLESQPRAWHADELVLTIYDVNSKSDKGFNPAKRVVVSEVIRAANRRNELQKLGDNYFASKDFVPQNNNGLLRAQPVGLTSEEPIAPKEIVAGNADVIQEREQYLDGNGGF